MRVVAPGKLVLVGEYAVVDGGPAVVAAIDHGVQVEVTPGPLRLDVPGGDDRFARAALGEADAPAAHYRFSDWRPLELDGKPGFGGSAAACVAAVVAADALAGRERDAASVFRRAFTAHRAVQGSGSGVDIAASAHGWVQRFSNGSCTPVEAVTPVVVFSGQSARTGPRVMQYLDWGPRDSFVGASVEIVELFDIDPVAALLEAHGLLAAMTTAAGIDWDTPALRHISAVAEDCGGAAKPSGAGGGDCAVALFDDPESRAAFVSRIAEAGLSVLPVALWGPAAIADAP